MEETIFITENAMNNTEKEQSAMEVAKDTFNQNITSSKLATLMAPDYEDERPLWEIDSDFINPYKVLPPIQTWCKMGTRPALPKEGLVTFSAKQKKGKSLSTYAIAIPLLSGNTFNTITPTDKAKRIMVFDMEMSETTLTNRVLRQVESIGNKGHNFVVCSLKRMSIEDRIKTIESKTAKYNPDIIVVDQAAKLVNDINSTIEANIVTDLLDKLSIGRSVWVVMHENKGDQDTNMRGHLGSALSFAAVEAYSVDRNGSVFTITPKEARDTDTEGAECFRFVLDADGHITDATAMFKAQRAEEVGGWYNNFKRVFGEDHELRHGEIVNRIMEQDKLTQKAARNKIEKAKDLGVITKISNDHNSPYCLITD